MINKTFFYLREYFFPSGCGGCGVTLNSADDALYGLCDDCRFFLEKALGSEKRCEICGKHLVSEKGICLSCRQRGAAEKAVYNEWFTKVFALFPYAGKYKSVLGSYKFGGSLGVGNFLAQCLSSALANFSGCGPLAQADCAWVPVPPRPGKIKKQGWDQIEYMAGILGREYKNSRETRLPVCRCLKRLPSRSQKELNRQERGSNLKGRILCIKKPPRTAVIFDDVITTGATLNACAEALLEGGAQRVYGACLFYD